MTTPQCKASSSASLAYEEPTLPIILTLSAFLVLLNVLHHIVDRALHAGIVAQLVLGAVFGAPLADILPSSVQLAVRALGFLGLLLLIVQGGMSTRLDILARPKTLALALATGATGIVVPIGLSMVLLPIAYKFTYLESFVVGASLSSTSLGTTLAVIGATGADGDVDANADAGILNTRIGTILVGAALLDDIVALVLSGVIASLGGAQHDVKPWSLARPIVSSVLLIVGTLVVARFAWKPAAPYIAKALRRMMGSRVAGYNWLRDLGPQAGMLLWLAVVSGFVSLAEEIDSTTLIGAFCAGAFTIYAHRALQSSPDDLNGLDPRRAYGAISVVQDRILSPFFFASIGFAIPVRDMFDGMTVWKGVLFAGLMALAKVAACLPVLIASLCRGRGKTSSTAKATIPGLPPTTPVSTRAWPPALFLGFALVARGEIGFLIINVARQVGILSCDNTATASTAFNVGVWAITLNTLVGPAALGLFLRADGMLSEIKHDAAWGAVQ